MSETVTMAKKRLQVTVRQDLVSWIDSKIEKGDYASRSHAIEKALIKLKEAEEKKP
jgi:Arc/MetJ-type ribon-helix-helix transcriptional regulator